MDLLKRENVQILDQAADWKDAIRISISPLEKGGYVKACYKEEVIGNVEKLGPYIVIADHIALPHARPEQGTISTQLGVTLFRKEVKFDGKEEGANLFISLAAADNSSHMDALVVISELLDDEDTVSRILASRDADELFSYFQ